MKSKLSDNPDAKRKREARAKKREARLEDRVREAKAEAPEPEPEPETREAPLTGESVPPLAEPEQLELPPLGMAPPPPGISVRSDGGGAGAPADRPVAGRKKDSAWRAKWRAEMAGGGSREVLCEQLADRGVRLLKKLDAIIEASGETEPSMTAEKIRPALVLTLDDLMPERVDAFLEKPLVNLIAMTAVLSLEAAGAIARIKKGDIKQPPPKPTLKSVPPSPPSPPAAPVPAPTPAPAPESPIKAAVLPEPEPARTPVWTPPPGVKIGPDGVPIM